MVLAVLCIYKWQLITRSSKSTNLEKKTKQRIYKNNSLLDKLHIVVFKDDLVDPL